MYCCVSKRFRKQVSYVLIDIHLNRYRHRQNTVKTNQIATYPMETLNQQHIIRAAPPHEVALY